MKNQRQQAIKEAIRMIRAQAHSILDAVMGADSTEQACKILRTRLPDRKHLTYWLGQVNHRKYVNLGRGLDFQGYLNAVVEGLRESNPDKHAKEQEEVMIYEDLQNTGEMVATLGVSDQTSPPPTLPPLPGFHLEGVSRNQRSAIRTMLVFVDCVVQKDESGVFDTLARNFDSNGFLSYFLNKIGYAHLTPYGKGRDLIDYIRKVAHEIHRDMKKSIGKPIARW